MNGEEEESGKRGWEGSNQKKRNLRGMADMHGEKGPPS